MHSSHDANLSTQERSKNQGPQSLNPYRLSPNPNSSFPQEEDSPNSTEREHTPIFKEHFDDDIGLVSDMHGGTSKHRTSTFMYQISLTESHPDPDPSSIPAFARGLPSRVSTVAEKESSHFSSPNLQLEVVHETNLIEGASTEVSSKPSPPISPPPVRSRASSNTDSPFQPAGLPKHFKSNASRFSFDLAGVGSSAQEKLLEEKHRQKAKREACTSDTSKLPHDEDLSHGVEDEDGYSDYDNMDDDGGLEERVPGVNADTEDAIAPVLPKDIESFHLLSPVASSFMSPSSPEINLPGTPRDDQGQPIGFALSNSSLNLQQSSPDKSVYATGNHSATDLGLRYEMIGSMEDHAHPLMNKTFSNLQSKPPLAGLPTRQQDDHDDDLYFDDGMIEDFDGNDIQAFDESVFDDDTSRVYGLPLRDLRLNGQDRKDTDCLQDKLSSSQKEQERNDPLLSDNYDKSMSTERSKTSQQIPDPSPKYGSRTTYSNAAGLTQDNLAAYHNALAFAANQAALNGEFNRRQSVDSRGQDGTPDDLPGMTPDDGRGSQEINDQNFSPALDDAKAFDFDDDLTDDPIIAAANAEVLENDDDGFYGQEFGFFARATGSGEYSNGGYFGHRGVEGLGRSHSGRANFQEPSLTPITERSEWSNRNSAISLAMQGYPQSAQHALPSPGLAQLADMLQLEEDNMSLLALMKLRRGAWGSSSTSLQSSSGSQISGSPLNILHVIPATTVASTTSSVQAHNFTSTNSLASSNGPNSGSDSDIAPSSPTVTLSSGNILSSVKPSRSESSPDLSLPVQKLSDPTPIPSRPRSSHLIGKVAGHSRNSSGAESVSYMHENDGDGNGGRWVVEKRRVGENGMMEILGREVLEGGRI